MSKKKPDSCSICGKPWTINPLLQEPTCFVHGRPNGSPYELRVWLAYFAWKKNNG